MHLATPLAAASVVLFVGCAGVQPCCDPCARQVGVPAPSRAEIEPRPPTPARAFVFHDGRDGTESSLDSFLAASRDADLVAFGELHGHPVGAAMELRTLEGMAAGARPVALAMEFFERDVQGALDAYLAGTSTEADFVKATRQGPAYPTTHRPLVEFAKARGLKVIAANSPRRLVTEYRKSDKAYADYLAGLAPADRALLPATTTVATGPYFDRFTRLMGGERGGKLIKAQSLWDDAMADAIATHRAVHPDVRVLLVVGGFHVAGRLGTITQFSARRPNDRVAVLVMSQGEPPALAFDPDDRGEGDVILTVAPVAPRPAPALAAPARPLAPAEVPKP